MLEVGAAILLATLILVRFGEMHILAAVLFGGLLAPAAAALVYFLRTGPTEVALGIVVAAVVLSSILREADEDRKQEGRRA